MISWQSSPVRADRLLSLLLLLRSRGRVTAPVLARELEVSTRTVLRDIEALSSAGIPVYAERGRAGGFALLPGFSTDLTGLTPDEAVALLTSPARGTTDALGLGPAFSSAIRKVVATMPETSRTRAEGAVERLHVSRRGWMREPAPVERLEVVQRAVFAGHRLRLYYASTARPGTPPPEPRWRTVDPIGLVEAAGQWYLLGLDGAQDRTYRVSRIVDAEELPEPAVRPDGIDLGALWERRRTEFLTGLPFVHITVRVPDELVDDLTAGSAAVLLSAEPDGPGWTVVRARFGGLRHAEKVLWAMAPQAEALEPPELRAALRARADATAARHR
jgi:predicted DNA-binding transcriptional regulator YafY